MSEKTESILLAGTLVMYVLYKRVKMHVYFRPRVKRFIGTMMWTQILTVVNALATTTSAITISLVQLELAEDLMVLLRVVIL